MKPNKNLKEISFEKFISMFGKRGVKLNMRWARGGAPEGMNYEVDHYEVDIDNINNYRLKYKNSGETHISKLSKYYQVDYKTVLEIDKNNNYRGFYYTLLNHTRTSLINLKI